MFRIVSVQELHQLYVYACRAMSISIPKQNEVSKTVLEDRKLFNYPKRVVSESVVIDHPPLFLQ